MESRCYDELDYNHCRDQSKSKLLHDEDDWSGWSDDKNNWNEVGDHDDDALEAWLNDDASAKSSKNKQNKMTSNDWQSLDGADKKSLKSSRNAKKKETLINSNDGWDDVQWDDVKVERSEPPVGNLLDLDINDSVQSKDSTSANDGWDNEVWAEADDDEWQSLDIDSSSKKK